MNTTHNKIISLALALAACAWMGSTQALAELGPKPALPESAADKAVPASGKIIARVDLLVGTSVLATAEGVGLMQTGLMLGPDSVIRVPAGARARIGFPNGDALHLGEGTTVALREQADGWKAQVWEGALMVYAAPSARGRGILETPQGALDAGEGKLGVVIPDGAEVALYAFNNWRAWDSREKDAAYRLDAAGQDWRIDANWRDNAGASQTLAAGRMLIQRENTVRSATLDPDIEVDLTHVTSPEGVAMRAALDLYQKGEAARARNGLQQVQRAFPRNAQAAYYLGLIALETEQQFEAIRQWQQYIQIDPQGATKQGIPERVTLLLNEEMRDEIQKALKQEAELNATKPEPGTVAVLPFVNRGDEAQAVLSKGLTAMVVTDLSKVPGIRVLERAKLQKLADEIALSQSGLVDEKGAVRAGRLMRAEKLMIGDYKIQDDGK